MLLKFLVTGVCIWCWFSARICAAATPSLAIQQLPGSRLQITWPGDAAGFNLEQSDTLTAPDAWQSVGVAVEQNGGVFSVTLPLATQTRFYRLRQSVALPTTIRETSPTSGESGVAVTRESIFRFSAPLAADVVLDSKALFAEFGGRQLLARPELSSDRKTATLFYLENLPASARVRVTLRATELRDRAGKLLDADGDGQPGGVRVLEFDTAGRTGLPGTAVIGKVFASEKNADGSNKPLANVTVTVDGAEEALRATTDATGAFTLSPAPSGRFFVHVDGRTAVGSRWPDGAYYPFVGKAWEAVAGKTNNLAGGSGEIFLPLVPKEALETVSATKETKITFRATVIAANPALAGVEISVPPNALFSDNGTRGGKVGMAPVPPDRLPEPLPPGLNLPLVITIQTDGASNFDVPVPVKFPNLPDPVTGVKLGPGARTVLWSFNHDTGRWEAQGTMTISADGQFAVTDPGVGVRQPGWHGAAPGSPAETPSIAPPNPPPPNRCDSEQELKMWWAIVDLGTDVAMLPLSVEPELGCAAGLATGSLRGARDCAFLDLDGCPESVLGNLVNAGLGCVPVFGPLLGTALSAGQTAREIDNYYDNCAGQAAAPAQARSSQSVAAGPPSFLQDMEKAQVLLLLQDQVNQALADLNALILGAPAWRSVEWRTPGREYIRLLQAVQAALHVSSPQAEAISAEERAGILGMPRPVGISPADVEALVNRFAKIVPGGLEIPATPANYAIFDRALELLEQMYAQGWRSPNDGAIQAIIILSRLLEPLPPGTLTTSTGGGARPRVFPSGRHHYLLVNLESGFAMRGRTTPQGTLQNLILAPNTRYSISYYTTESSALSGPSAPEPRLGMAMFTSQATGAITQIPYAVLLKDEFPDSDGDGLSDNAEVILGTGPYRADSDGDGIKDGQELSFGTNPLDGVGMPTGVVSVAPTPGAAFDVAAGNNLALLACIGGLAVFDVSNPQSPVQVAVVPGAASAVALRGSLALAAFADGIRLLDLAVPATPRILWARPDLKLAAAVTFGGEAIFVLWQQQLIRLDLATGFDLGAVHMPGESMITRGELVYVLSADWLNVCRAGDVIEVLRTLAAPGHGGAGGRPRRLFLDGNLLYAQHAIGFNVLDLRDPESPILVNDVKTASAGWRQIVSTGTGFALAAVGPNSTADGPHDVSLYRLITNNTDARFVATFETPGEAYAVAIAGARGFVADGTAGLAVVNFLDPDLAGIPPTVATVMDSSSTPHKLEGGSLARIQAMASDDIAVAHVDFLVNGTVVSRDDSYPFEIFHRLPPFSPTSSTLQLRTRAEDTSGNVSESADLTVAIVTDATPPGIISLEPSPRATIPIAVITDLGVAFTEPIATPVSDASLVLRSSGADGTFDTPDDETLTGDVQWLASDKMIRFRLATPLLAGRYRAMLAAGLADGAGNARARPLIWDFETGPPPIIVDFFPPQNLVRVGGTLEELVFEFNQPVPGILADSFVWKVSRRLNNGPLTEVTPLQVLRSTDSRTFTLRAGTTFVPGFYRVTGTGPNMEGMLWEFYFRDVPNEATGLSETGTGPVTLWKYFPGPGAGDELIVNLPGQTAPISGTHTIRSLVAQSDIRFVRQRVNTPEPIEARAGLEIISTRFGPGVTHVRGPIAFVSSSIFDFTEIGPHTLHAYGGGFIRNAVLHFADPNGALVNHPGSMLVLSNGTSVANTGVARSDFGRLVNLGTLRSSPAGSPPPTIQLEDVRVRNDGLIDVAAGGLKISSLEGDGTIQLAAGARMILAERVRGGFTSRITGSGAIEFGELGAGMQTSADAEWKGEVDPGVAVTLVAGTVTLWKPLVRPAGAVELRNGSLLKLLGPADIGTVTLTDGDLAFNSDSQIGHIDFGLTAQLRSEALVRVTGTARIGLRMETAGQGSVEFAGLTIVSNRTQIATAQIGHASIRNTGTWQQSGGGSSGSGLLVRRENDELGTGVFENAGLFELTTDRVLNVTVPFRNLARAVFSRGPVIFDGRVANERFGSYRHGSAAELVLNNTDFQHDSAGSIEFTGGIVRGTGSIRAVDGTARPKVTNRAVLRPGNPVGALTIRATGGFEQVSTGEIVVTLASTDHSRLILASTAAVLAGTLRVETAEGFAPTLGQTFSVMTFTSHAGEFDSVVLPNLGAGKKLETVYSATAVTLRVAAAP